MSRHPVLDEKLSAARADAPPVVLTRRDARLPVARGKVHAVIGMRRSGEATFLRQLLDERRVAGPTERATYLSFDDDRLADLEVDQLGFLLEGYYRRHPALRGRATPRLLVLDRDARARVNTPRIEVLPAYEWLLAAPVREP